MEGELFLVIFLFTHFPLSSTIYTISCPLGWSKWVNACYLKNEKPMNWTSARRFCQTFGGDLAAPNSKEENDWMRSFLPQIGFWIGCIRAGRNQFTCFGDDSSRDNYRNVYESVYSIYESFNRAVMRIEGSWQHIPEAGEFPSLCEMALECFTSRVCFAAATDGQSPPSDHCLIDHAYKQIVIKHPLQCCIACTKEPECRSFNLMESNECQLNNVTRNQIDQGQYFVQMGDCAYYEYN